MTVEAVTKISDFNVSLPAAGDSKSEGDDHIRNLKVGILGSLSGLDTTGVVGFNVVTQPTANSSTLAASTALVDAKVTAAGLSSALPGQLGNAGKFVTTDGATASWASVGQTVFVVSGTTQAAVAGKHYVLNNVAATAVTMPTTFAAGDQITVSQNNGLFTNTVDFGAKTVRGSAGTATGVVTMNLGAPMELVAIDTNTWMML